MVAMVYKYYDQKVKRLEKLSRSEQEDILLDLISAFSLIKSVEDSALFIQDLLTEAEVRMLSKRLRIAKLLLAGNKYDGIMGEIHVSRGTIAKVAAWLNERGEGFKKVIKKLPEPEKVKEWWEKADWEKLMARYPRYFWPLMLNDVGKKESIRGRKKLLKDTVKGLDEKYVIRKRVQEVLDEEYKRKHEAGKRRKRKESTSSN